MRGLRMNEMRPDALPSLKKLSLTSMYVCMHACMDVRMYVWMDVCMYVCLYVCVHHVLTFIIRVRAMPHLYALRPVVQLYSSEQQNSVL
jgi:hypothetical protein